ncbi:MAG: putative quinol monooxygenase [Flavobacteriales bacterium]
MVTRIVKMTFRSEACEDFLALFHQYKDQIRNADGCKSLTLMRCVEEPNIFFTYSQWVDEKHLDDYRFSDTFAKVWPQTKILFEAAPEAWTNEVMVEMNE